MTMTKEVKETDRLWRGYEYWLALRKSRRRRALVGVALRVVAYSVAFGVLLAALSLTSGSQTLVAASTDPPNTQSNASAPQLSSSYTRPTQGTRASNYVFDTFGPYPVAGALIGAGISQFHNSPPEWNQGVEGYVKRFGSDFAIAGVRTTTRYALAQAFNEDTSYYRCECRGILPRLRHAATSTLIGRRGEDGHRDFSLPDLVAPYAGSMTAVYGWYPNRYSAKDAFRLGNYGMLGYMTGNVTLEFLYSGPHSLLSRIHLNNAHGSPVQGPNK